MIIPHLTKNLVVILLLSLSSCGIDPNRKIHFSVLTVVDLDARSVQSRLTLLVSFFLRDSGRSIAIINDVGGG
jgi:hypothetical protein